MNKHKVQIIYQWTEQHYHVAVMPAILFEQIHIKSWHGLISLCVLFTLNPILYTAICTERWWMSGSIKKRFTNYYHLVTIWNMYIFGGHQTLIQWTNEPHSISNRLACCAIKAQRDICPVFGLRMLCYALACIRYWYAMTSMLVENRFAWRNVNISVKFHKQYVNHWTRYMHINWCIFYIQYG